MDHKLERLRDLLDERYDGEFDYIFKFVVPIQSLNKLKVLLCAPTSTEKLSKNGNYVSVTFCLKASCSQDVIEIYERVSCVDGLISL